MKTGICTAVGVVGGFIASLFGGWDAALTTLLIFMGVDYITGLIVAGVFHRSQKSTDGALESRAGWKGLCRKGTTLLVVLVACRLDLVTGSTFIRDTAIIAFIANETISIIENAGLMGVPIPAVVAKAIDILKKVGIPEAETRIDYYPHQFSGGQKQRIVIAMALVLNPGLILADEPTTALDVTVQAEILDLLRLARDEFDASVLIITHNMGVIADIADQVVVMYRGHVVEQGDVESIFYHPSHPYTQRLLAAVPRIGQKLVVRDVDGKPIDRTSDWHDEPLAVEAKGLTITYPGHLMQPDFVAVDGIDFAIHRSEVLGLVGESGSGKSTTGRAIAGLQKVSGGSLNVLGVEMNGVRERDFKPKRADIGFVFQDPGSSFNPLMTIAENVAEPLIVHRKYSSVADAKEYVGDLLEMVQLPRAYMSRFPHELSGGQRQRASLARALALKPSLLIADEPTSALDVSVQAKVLELFKKLQVEIGFACLFITHDLAVVDMLADRIMVMHKGRIVEHGDADDIMQRPSNQYTKKLLASLPVPDPREQQKHRAHLHELLAAENAA